MTPKTILVHLDQTESAPAVLQSALTLGAAYGTHIIGLAATVCYPIYGDLAVGIPPVTLDEMNAPSRRLVQRLKTTFEEKLSTYPGTKEWRNTSAFYADVLEQVVREVHGVDLIVCSQDTVSELNGAGAVKVDELVMRGGRPVLVIPKNAPLTALPKHVVIAWNTTRESARAVFDAIDLIQNADSVRVLTVVEHEVQRDRAVMASMTLLETLKRHGISARGRVKRATGADVAKDLIDQLPGEECDFLVMGCYGHSRFREMIFGGMTRGVLSEVPVPTLMSH